MCEYLIMIHWDHNNQNAIKSVPLFLPWVRGVLISARVYIQPEIIAMWFTQFYSTCVTCVVNNNCAVSRVAAVENHKTGVRVRFKGGYSLVPRPSRVFQHMHKKNRSCFSQEKKNRFFLYMCIRWKRREGLGTRLGQCRISRTYHIVSAVYYTPYRSTFK